MLRFLRKTANLSTILPAVAGPAIGGFAGRALGARYNAENLGAMLGGITGGVTGQLLREKMEQQQRPALPIPANAMFAMDPTSRDIPAWALQGAQLLKQSNLMTTIGPDIGGLPWVVGEGIHNKTAPKQIAKNVAGQGLGILGGGYAGHAIGGMIDKAVGRPVTGPFGVPLSTLLAGLGATIGNAKGLEFANK